MSLFETDLWTDDVETLRGEMFIWAKPKPEGGWSTGLGYWNKSGGWSADPGYPEPRATRFHPMPSPPKQ